MVKIESVLNYLGSNLTIDGHEFWLQVIATGIVILWFETFLIGTKLKRLFKFDPYEYKKPFDCRFCTHFWIGSAVALCAMSLDLFILNLVTSQFYERTFTK